MVFSLVKLPELQAHMSEADCALIINEVNEGSRRASGLFQEAFLHTDLPLAFNSLTNKQLIPQYAAAEPVHGEFTQDVTLNDLRPQGYLEVWPSLDSLPRTEGGKERIPGKAPKIAPNTEYPAITLDESSVELKLDKYGLRLPLTIEMIINDQLAILANYPEALAVFLRQLEDIVVAEALIKDDRSGARANITHVTGDPLLSIDSVSAALQQFSEIKVNGRRTNLSRARLLIPRTLEQTVKRLVSIQSYDQTIDGKTFKNVGNPVYGMAYTVFDALTDVNTSASAGQTWFLLANDGQLAGRPSLAAAKLRGYLQPQQFISSPNALTPAGGMANWKDGSFTNDSIEFKARHFFGSKLVLAEGVLVSEPTVV